MLRPMKIDDIEFGVVERAVTIGTTKRPRGSEITYGELKAMPTANRNALIENRFISVFPKGVQVRREGLAAPVNVMTEMGPATVIEGELLVYAKGFGKWDVVKGTVVAANLTREQALEMAGKPPVAAEPAAKKPKHRPKTRGGHLPAKQPGEDQDNGPVEG